MAFSWNPLNWSKMNQARKQEASQEERVVPGNPNYQVFTQVNSDIARAVNSKSVVSNMLEMQNSRFANPSWQTFYDGSILALPLPTNKIERIGQYRKIAKYTLCDWCMDEIADDFIHEDENGRFIHLNLPDRLNDTQKDILQNEFEKFIDLFRLRDDGYNLVKRFLTEGELAWENVINPKYPELGIVGVRFLPAEYYETLIDVNTNLPVGIVFDTQQFADTKRQMFSNTFMGAASIFNSINPVTYNFHFSKDSCVPMLWSQVTYINSGEYSHDNLVSYPLIEKAKADYHRLALMEDAAVILRVTRAPEKLLFNISTGKMPQKKADEYIRRFAEWLKSKRTPTPDGRDVAGVYDPPTMLQNFVFGHSDGNDGTQVESVGSSADYDQLADIEFFLRKFLKQFKVPWSRFKTPENTIERNDTISYEEYSFSRMIIRFQRRFAEGFKRAFITHLKLRDIWEKETYELLESDIKVEFVKPVLFDLYQTQKQTDVKTAIYKDYVDQDEISKTLAMKKILGYTDKDIEENFMALIREKMMNAVADVCGDMVKEDNLPVDIKIPLRLRKQVEAEQLVAQGKKDKGEESKEGGDEGGADEGAPPAPPSDEPAEEEQSEEPPSFGLD